MTGTLDDYLSSRATLLADDRSLRRDSTYLATQDATEKQAEALVRRIRFDEAATIWSGEHEEIPHVFPGTEFLTAKNLIETTRLFQIVRKMPKGGLLHIHLDATVDIAILFQMALEQPALHIRVDTVLTSDNMEQNPPEFRPFPSSEYGERVVDMTSSRYVPGQWVPLRDARENFSLGPELFDKWVLGAMTINPIEAYKTHNTVPKIWKKFTNTFLASRGLILFAPIWEEYIKKFLFSCVDDRIMYVEARINFLHRFMYGTDGQENVPHAEWLIMFDKAVNFIKTHLQKENRGDEFVGARVIYTTLRFITPEELEWYLEDCIQLKQKFPHLIAGFDLVGNENELHPLKYYLGPLLRFKDRQKQLGIDIPFLFHAGETLGDGSEADDNLFDAVLLGTKRIGHGFSLVKHPKIMEVCRERGIALEVCPISNEILRLTSSMPMHPLPILFNNGIPVALSSDDPAVFGNLNLSYDFFQVLVSSEVSGLTTLAVTARDSIEFSTLDVEEKSQVLDLWEKQWKMFVKDICLQYGHIASY